MDSDLFAEVCEAVTKDHGLLRDPRRRVFWFLKVRWSAWVEVYTSPVDPDEMVIDYE